MCTNADYGLTMAGLLGDPLIQMVMRSDGVSDEAHAALWHRVQDALLSRFGLDADTVVVGAG